MKRSDFLRTATGSISLSVLPSCASYLVKEPTVKINRIRIGLDRETGKIAKPGVDVKRDGTEVLRGVVEGGPSPAGPSAADDENNYWAEAITIGDQCFYRAKGTTVAATAHELSAVIGNPHLCYFTTALKLHMRINAAKTGTLASNSL